MALNHLPQVSYSPDSHRDKTAGLRMFLHQAGDYRQLEWATYKRSHHVFHTPGCYPLVNAEASSVKRLRDLWAFVTEIPKLIILTVLKFELNTA